MKTTVIKAGELESEPVTLAHFCLNALQFLEVPDFEMEISTLVSFDSHTWLPLVVDGEDMVFRPGEPCVFYIDREWFDAAQYVKFCLKKTLQKDFSIGYNLREDK